MLKPVRPIFPRFGDISNLPKPDLCRVARAAFNLQSSFHVAVHAICLALAVLENSGVGGDNVG